MRKNVFSVLTGENGKHNCNNTLTTSFFLFIGM